MALRQRVIFAVILVTLDLFANSSAYRALAQQNKELRESSTKIIKAQAIIEKIQKQRQSFRQSLANRVGGVPKVTVIGGGPAGLISALESYFLGADVVLVEKYVRYLRPQLLVVFPESERILSKFIGEGYKDDPGLMQINELEERLYATIEALAKVDPDGMKVFYGYEFKLDNNKIASLPEIKISKADRNIAGPEVVSLKTNFLIGADASHSQVRQFADIKVTLVSTGAEAMIAVFENQNPQAMEKKVEEREEQIIAKEEQLEKNKTSTDYYNFVNAQKSELLYSDAKIVYLGVRITKADLDKLNALRENFTEKQNFARKIIAERLLFPDIFADLKFIDSRFSVSAFTIELQKAQSNAKVINDVVIALVGDAAGTTHFFTGTGMNNAISDAMRIGKLVVSAQSRAQIAEQYAKETDISICKMQELVLKEDLGLKKLERDSLRASTPGNKKAKKSLIESGKSLIQWQGEAENKILNNLGASCPRR